MLREKVISNKRLRHFNEDERRYILLSLAQGRSLKECVHRFQRMFPDFGRHVEISALKSKLRERVRNIKRNHPDDIQDIANLTIVDWKDGFSVDCLFKMLYSIWLDTPAKSLVNVRVDSTGVKRSVYKINAAIQIEVLEKARKMTNEYPGTLIAKLIPITDPIYRLNFLERLLSEIPLQSFLRYSRKEGRDIYTSHVKLLLRVLRQAMTELRYLPVDSQIPFPQFDAAREKIRQLRIDGNCIEYQNHLHNAQ